MKSKSTFLRSVKLLAMLLLLVKISHAQGSLPVFEQTVIPSTPNASALSRYIDYPVSLSTGVPDISLPLYTFTSKKLSVPISLSYHAGGIKVSDKSVTMGAGWTLNAGGAISRVIRDIPDESENGYLNMIYPNEAYFTSTQKSYCLANGLINIYTDGAVKQDGEPDIFYYNFLDQGGKFLFRNRIAPDVTPKPVTIPYSPIKIDWPQIILKPCIITGTNGDTYRFEYVGDNYYLPASYLFDPNRGTTPTAWYLTKIISADKTDSISFVYETGLPNHVNYNTHTAQSVYSAITFTPGAAGMTVRNGITDYTLNTSRLKEITSVNGKVHFTYDNTTSRLNKIDIYNNVNNVSSEIKSLQIYQSQFQNCTRTRLDSIMETGYVNNVATKTNPPYKFTYYSSDAPPDFTFDQDLWGFYNGNGNSDMLLVKSPSDVKLTYGVLPPQDFVPAPEKRAVNAENSKKGSLTGITYPTGGNTNFTMEPNQITTTVNTDTVLYIPPTVHGMTNFDMVPNDPVSGVSLTFQPKTPNVVMTFTASVYCHSGSCTSSLALLYLYDITLNQLVAALNLGHFNDSKTYDAKDTYTLDVTHQYRLYFPTPGLISNYNQTPYYRLNASVIESYPYNATTLPALKTVLAGGLRIRQIQHNDGKGSTLTKTYNYTKPYFNSEVYQGNIGYMLSALTKSQYLLQSNATSITGTSFYHYGMGDRSKIYGEGISIPVGGSSNSSVSYQEVEEVMTGNNNTTSGKTVYTFNTARDFVDHWFPFFRLDRDLIRSQLLDKKIYKNDSNGSPVLINQVTNTYNNVNDFAGDTPGRDSIKFYAAYTDFNFQELASRTGNYRMPNEITGGDSPSNYSFGCPIFGQSFMNYFHILPYYYHVVRPLLSSTVTTNFDLNGQNPVSSEIDYNYDNYAHMLPTRITTKNSDQKIKIQTIKYPLDYNYQASCNLQSCVTSFNQQLLALNQQKDQDQWAAVGKQDRTGYDQYEAVYTSSVKQLASLYNTCVSQFTQCYATAENNLPATDKAIAYMQDKNVIASKVDVTTTVDGTQTEKIKTDYQAFSSNIVRPQQINVQTGTTSLEAREQFYAYDASGNLLEQSKTGGAHSAYQWDYNGTYLVAQANNAKNQDIFYDSFENGNGNSTVNDSKTGHYSYTGGYSKALSGLDAGSYILTYWLKSASDNTWSLQTSPVNVAASTYSISIPAGQIDDVCFYPSNAQMTTYTYDPLVGMTSSTDSKNMTTYYEYDGLQRLINIKDNNRNIIKHTDYHYQNQ
ncbi:hypothetical protein [Pedobacter cryoconitis]|uniref:YD repeat-containing protein n=1 Tax=Pedobacter cryoconitis TaxID=188932 RepID=A0A7X0J6J2_9SPHI|nr:hypothetical protein [Pedobacter cryoconitis]MBB6500772.1 hypothetical protein [Pedobacter cryoconitis]